MRKLTLLTLGLGLVISLAVMGCATGGGANPEEEIKGALVNLKTAFVAGDIDKIMGVFSEDFSHYEWTDKATLKAFLSDAIDQGMMDNAEVNLEDVKLEKGEEGKYIAYPIDIDAAFGSATIECTYKKETVGWMVVGMEVEGI